MTIRDRFTDIGALRLFVDVASLGSISAAARRANISQPAATQRLAKLERRTGLGLLQKTPRGTRLSKAGRQVLQAAQDVLRASDDFSLRVEAARAHAEKPLRIAASYTISEYLFHHWVAYSDILGDGMQIGLSVGNSDAVCRRILAGEAALGFIEAPTYPSELDSMVVAVDELVLVVAHGHPWANEGEIPVATLRTTPLIMREPGSGTRMYAEQLLATDSNQLSQPVMELGSTSAVKAAVYGGVGATLISRLAVQSELRTGSLVQVGVSGEDLRRELRAVFPRGERASSAAERVVAAAQRVGLAMNRH